MAVGSPPHFPITIDYSRNKKKDFLVTLLSSALGVIAEKYSVTTIERRSSYS
jgi:hypothetical protein